MLPFSSMRQMRLVGRRDQMCLGQSTHHSAIENMGESQCDEQEMLEEEKKARGIVTVM